MYQFITSLFSETCLQRCMDNFGLSTSSLIIDDISILLQEKENMYLYNGRTLVILLLWVNTYLVYFEVTKGLTQSTRVISHTLLCVAFSAICSPVMRC